MVLVISLQAIFPLALARGKADFFLNLGQTGCFPFTGRFTGLFLGKNLSSIYPWKSNCPEANSQNLQLYLVLQRT